MFPIVSVIMSTYNTPDEWLCESIESILKQSFSAFEFIIIDDCSTQSIDNIKEKFKDERIVWIRNKVNLGLTKSLNIALKMAKGKYVARMDADDISLPERFATQVEFMDAHPEVIVCGSYRRAFGNENKNEIWEIPSTREEQQVQLFFFNCGLTHPTAMFRKEMLDKFQITYNEEYVKAQDYGIWVQCTRYAPMAMIPKVLLQYRKSDQQISTAERKNQLENDRKIKLDQLKALGIDASEYEKDMHVAFCRGENWDDVENLQKWMVDLAKANSTSRYFSEKVFSEILKKRWYDWCKKEYKEAGNVKARDVYKKAKTMKYCYEDVILSIKQFVAKMIGRGR